MVPDSAEHGRAERLEAHLSTIVNSAEDAVISSSLDGTITSWNRAAERMYGYRADEVIGQPIAILIPPELLDEEDKIQERIRAGESFARRETVRLRKDASRVAISATTSPIRDADGRVIGISKIARDITARKQAEVRLRSMLNEVTDLKTALDEHAIVAITDPQGRITYVNDKFCSISQYSREQLLGQDHRLINSGYHSKEFFRELWTTISQGRVWKGEIRNRARDGSYYWVETTIVPFLNAEGKPYQYVAIRTDVSELKRAEDAIRKFNEDLGRRVRERTAQLEAANHELGAFAHSVSHDLRAPLRHIDGFAALLTKSLGPELSPASRHYLEQIIDSARQMGRLIDDLLVFSRMGRTEVRRASVNLEQVVEDALRGLEPEMHGRRIVWEKQRLPTVRADPAMMRQVFANLLSNALKYTRPRDPARIEIGCAGNTRDEVVVFVRDNGVGFDMRFADKLFGVFQRLHRDDQFEGTGVGLANVRRIIGRHGGRTWADAKLDGGATFYFSLPNDGVEEG